MENKNKNKKVAIYIAVLIALLGGSFIIFKIVKASTNNAIISNITMTKIETGTNLNSPGEDNLVTNCVENVCTSTYTASKDSSNENILVKSFDKIKYTFNFNVIDSEDAENNVEDVKVNLRITLNDDDKKYVTFDENNCDKEGLCIIRNNNSYESSTYSVVLNVNNAPNGYQIHPTFTFDVEENKNDSAIVLGYNNDSPTKYYYSYSNETYSSDGPVNPMPTIVSSIAVDDAYVVAGESTFTQAANYSGTDGRFITYLLGIKLNTGAIPGTYYDKETISLKVSFSQDGNATPITNENWIRFYGSEIVDGIRPVSYAIPYSTSNIGDPNKYIKKPGSLNVTKDGNSYILTISNYALLLDKPSLNADNSESDGLYIATIAITNFSPRLESDGQDIINNTMILSSTNDEFITSKSIQNTYEQLGKVEESDSSNVDILTTSAWYDENELRKLSDNGTGSVSKGTTVKYVTRFKNNRSSSNQGLKEIIKFDTNAYRVLPYDEAQDLNIKIKCGKEDCKNISKNDFEIKFVSGSFDNSNYELNDTNNLKLSSNDKALANACSNIDLTTLNKDQIQNLYGGPCIRAKAGVETVYNNINDSYKVEQSTNVEVPISKVIVQTKEGVTLPDGAEVIISVKVRVRNVSDITHTYQATTMISTSDYDENLYYFAPQIKNISDTRNNALSPDSYIKTTYSGQDYNTSYGYIGDSLKIVNFTLRQKISPENKNSDGSVKTKYRTVSNETIVYKVETTLNDNNIKVGADDTWYIKNVHVIVTIPKTLIYIPDEDLINPISVVDTGTYTVLEYELITPNDKIKSNMKIKDIYFKTKLSPTLSGKAIEIVVNSYPVAENINGERDTSIGTSAESTIYGTGINEVIGTASVGESGSLIEKDGIIDYVLNAYNNIGEAVNDYSFIDVLPYKGDTNGSDFNGSYSVKVTSETVSLDGIKCTKELPSKISVYNDNIWEDCTDITNDFIDGVTAIRMDNISIDEASYMGDIIVSLKTKDNKASNKYNNMFVGSTRTSSDNASNIIEVSVINRTISGVVFLDNTGDSVKDGNESYISDIPISLYKVTNDGILKKIDDTVTDENGYYEFNNLDKGTYKIRSKFDISKYDLTLRYATEDITKDSDAYLIESNGTIEISNKSETSKGLVLSTEITNISNMDIGLQLKHKFGFVMDKYITRIDLSNNGIVTTNTYDNLSTVSLNVINPKKYTTKVYYGIAITNNSNKAGYINLVKEDIPSGFIFDKNYPENAGWFEVDGMIGNRTLENTLVNPNETVYLQIVLFIPARDEAGTFVNTASVAEITEYNPIENEPNDKEYVNTDEYSIGDSLRFAGVNFHVIGTTQSGNEQILTLLADSNQVTMGHLSNENDVYKWSNSNINRYINNDWIETHNINSSALVSFNICDDASGLFNNIASGGVVDANNCASNIYTTSKVRLLTQAEFNTLVNNLTDTSFLLNGDFWLMDSVYATETSNTYNEYGILNTNYDTSNLVKYVKSSNSTVLPVQGSSGFNKEINGSSKLQVRPVIRISTNNIILE